MATTIRRRRFIGFAVVSAASWPLAMRAQQRALPVIGFLGYGSAEFSASRVRSFRQGLDLVASGVEERIGGDDQRAGLLLDEDREGGVLGFTSMAIVAAPGTNSCSSSNFFAASVSLKKATPVKFPPGRLRLATRPNWMGSAPITNTIGTALVVALAANDAGKAVVKITATLRSIKSCTSAGSW